MHQPLLAEIVEQLTAISESLERQANSTVQRAVMLESAAAAISVAINCIQFHLNQVVEN